MKKAILLFSVTLLMFVAQAQNYSKQDEANYIFGFARLMDWPQYEGNQVIVNVLGETVVLDYLNFMSQNNEVGGRKLVARQANLSNAVDCNILFVTADKTYMLPEINALAVNKNVLIITESPNMIYSGADVSFASTSSSTGESALAYIFNLSSIQEKNINVAIEFIGYGLHQKTENSPELEPEPEPIIED
jgi:YfiR/HmsC-like